MPRTPLAAVAAPSTFARLTDRDFIPGAPVVRVSLGGDSLIVNAADWELACEELVALHPTAGAPSVERPAAVAPAAPAPAPLPVPAPSVATLARPVPVAAEPVRGETVDLEGAVRSGADLLAAEEAGFSPRQPFFTRGTMVVDLGVDDARRSRVEHDAKPTVRDYCDAFVTRIRSEQRADLSVQPCNLSMDLAGGIHDADSEQRLAMSRKAFDSFCARAGFGGADYLARCWPELRAHNVNAWLERLALADDDRRAAHIREQLALPARKRREFVPEQLVLRTRTNPRAAGREVFGVVSPSYSAFDVDRVAEALALAAPADARGTVDYDGTRAKFEIIFHSNVQPEKYVAGEFFKAGVIVRTDDTGGGSLRGSAVVYQNLCLNLICIDEATQELFRIRHLGSVNAMAAKFRAGFDAALAKIAAFRKAWGYAVEENVIETARAANPDMPVSVEEALPGLFNAIVERELVPVRGRADVVVPKLMEMWRKDTSAAAGPTRAAVLNAFTRYAHEVNEDPWAEDGIQRAAGALLYGRRGARPAPLPWLPIEA